MMLSPTVPLFTPEEVFVKEPNTPDRTWTCICTLKVKEKGVNVCAFVRVCACVRAFPGNSLWQSLSAVGEEKADK